MLRRDCVFRVAFLMSAAVAICSTHSTIARACELCGPPSVTLAEQLSTAEHVLLVKWVAATLGVDGKSGSATFEIVRVLRPAESKWKPGDSLGVARYLPGERAKQYLLFGKNVDTIGKSGQTAQFDWGDPTEATETTCRYVFEAPAFDAPSIERLAFYAKHLEHSELAIANDAHSEFVNARAEAIAAAAKSYPRANLRRWLADKKTPVNRLAAYGLMLGHCGLPEDAPFFERLISDSTDPRRCNSAGIMAGYLFLARDRGLQNLARTKLADNNGSLDQAYPALQAVRYLWSYGEEAVPREVVQRVVRRLIARPEFFDLAIVDLARWKDWSVMPQVVALYGTRDFDDRASKKVIIRYLLAATKDVPDPEPARAIGQEQKPKPQHVTDAERYLSQLRVRDATLIAEVEKFFYLR